MPPFFIFGQSFLKGGETVRGWKRIYVRLPEYGHIIMWAVPRRRAMVINVAAGDDAKVISLRWDVG